MIELNCDNIFGYIHSKLCDIYNTRYETNTFGIGITVCHEDVYVCKIYKFDDSPDKINIYHVILQSDIIYGKMLENSKNLIRNIDSDILYNQMVIDKIIAETRLYLDLSIKKVDLINSLDELKSINPFNNIESDIRKEKLKFINELN